jgi:hypothetical protein
MSEKQNLTVRLSREPLRKARVLAAQRAPRSERDGGALH